MLGVRLWCGVRAGVLGVFCGRESGLKPRLLFCVGVGSGRECLGVRLWGGVAVERGRLLRGCWEVLVCLRIPAGVRGYVLR